MIHRPARMALLTLPLLCVATPLAAQAQDGGDADTTRYRVGLGPQVQPSYPGADRYSLRPFADLSRAKGDEFFPFEAPDQSFGLRLLRGDRFAIGPVIGFEGKRKRSDTDGILDRVGNTVELGGFVQYQLADPIRARAELRQGVGGHKGLISDLSLDYVARQGDDWVFSIGPRTSITSGKYQRAYFEVPFETGGPLRSYRPDGGFQSVGVAAGYLKSFGPHWGVYAYAKYDRLIGDPADSPVTRRFGSRNQPSGGIALTYTFRR